MNRRIAALFLYPLLSLPAWSDDPPKPAGDTVASAVQLILDKVDAQIAAGDRLHPFANAAATGNVTDFIRLFQATIEAGATGVQANQTDKQTNSSPTSAGSTSLASKGSTAEILSMAVDNGGLTREVSGTTVTFSGTPLGLLEAFKGYDTFGILSSVETDGAKKALNALAFTISFDTSRGSVPNTLLANSQQLSSWSARAAIFNQRDAKRRQYALLWHTISDKFATKAGDAELASLKEFEKWQPYLVYRNAIDAKAAEFDTRYRSAPSELATIKKDFTIAVTELVKNAKFKDPPNKLASTLKNVTEIWAALDGDASKVMTYVQRGQLLTVDWTTKRDPVLPDLYANTIIYQASPWKNRAHDFTVNGVVDWYRVAPKTPAGTGRLKDVNLVGDYAIPLGTYQPIGKFVLSFTGKYQYVAASVVNATSLTSTMPTTTPSSSPNAPPAIGNLLPTLKGNLGAFQVKLTIPGGKSGIKIPIAFTAATRSEVFNRADYRANVGLSFDLDSLFAKNGK